MIEEGPEWSAHVQTRRHRRLAGKPAKVPDPTDGVPEPRGRAQLDASEGNADVARDLFESIASTRSD